MVDPKFNTGTGYFGIELYEACSWRAVWAREEREWAEEVCGEANRIRAKDDDDAAFWSIVDLWVWGKFV